MYEIEVEHVGLHKYRVIRGRNLWEVEQKAEAQRNAWYEMWEKKVAREKAISEKQHTARAKAQNHEDNKEMATSLTEDAQNKITVIENTLSTYLKSPAKVNWNSLKSKKKFPIAPPDYIAPAKEADEAIPYEPKETDKKYIPQISWFDCLIPGRSAKKIAAAKGVFERGYAAWTERKQQIIERNLKRDADHAIKLQQYQEQYNLQYVKWEAEKAAYESEQKNQNSQIDARMQAYIDGAQYGVEDLVELVLYNSDYPDAFPEEYDVEYNPETKLIIVDYILPNPEQLPTLKDVKYIQSRCEFKESHLTESAINKLYDDLLYQIILRTIHEVFSADEKQHIQSITTNGWVDFIDKANGQNTKACIMSLHTTREEFTLINLSNVDPKTCFKKLKGVGSSKLHSLIPVAPLMKINREDSRFVDSYDVVHTLDDSVNLAAMDWQDFEHLIRELFEKEFSQSGGEVRITQASRDGGVDAVVFDPDPIRGGKIVIQAKRYTNTVGLSSVRDLYGTVVNEGAIKGILVSTADYGPDAYNFAKDKPLTLMTGANLLFLLQKHGHKAKIDLKEAKKILSEQAL